ncbi:MAG: hypothetical protein IPO07_26825 [Haliscomenobacter sp.]|nr:ATP-binding protein [Haliscomenobacter sp.]MBK9492012.1 hypothetical protein [Haliscomenobacter sp.]
MAKSKNLIFHYEQSHTQYITYFDADKIEKIVTNLLSNAIKFSSEHGRVELRVKYTPQQVILKYKIAALALSQNGYHAFLTVFIK